MTIQVGAHVTPLTWTGEPLAVEPLVVVAMWRRPGQAWAKLSSGRNYLVELLREEMGNE